ncbi:MAG: sulfotransferase family protein [Oceanococcus sp.]
MNKPFHPYRPTAIAILNGMGRALGWRAGLNPADLIKTAEKRTGLKDWGEHDFRPALEQLCSSAIHEANMHPFGRWVFRKRVLDLLTTRLRVQDLIRQHPEICEREINPPLVIAGLQRTGTTMLHRLLSADPGTRALQSWEAINPMPHPKETPGDPQWRIKQALTAEKGLKYLSPEFFAIHPVEATAPEEDVLLLEYSFLSDVPEATLNLPSYSQWLSEQDLMPAYQYLKLLLQVLDWQNPGQRWVLKTPAHLGCLDELLTVFPQSKIVQTHRDPARITASFSSMLAHGYGVFSDQVEPDVIARHWLEKNAGMVNRAMLTREQHPQAFLDVNYADVMQNPMTQVERIYAFAGIELNTQAREAMQASLQANKKDRHGKHRYSLDDFDLSLEDVEQAYALYINHFQIPSEQDKAA